jgi:hypothetical protein
MVLAAAYVIMELGLNIVVGFAGLLDLGYVAFFAIDAHVAGYFGSAFWDNVADGGGIALLVGEPAASMPGIHLNFLVILVPGAVATTIAGVLTAQSPPRPPRHRRAGLRPGGDHGRHLRVPAPDHHARATRRPVAGTPPPDGVAALGAPAGRALVLDNPHNIVGSPGRVSGAR